MKKNNLLIVALLFFSAFSFAQENNETNLPKGKVYNNPIVDISKSYTTESIVVESNSNKWQAESKHLFTTGAYKANATYNHQSSSIKLPKLTSKNERINLYLTEAFELESYYDEGKVQISTDNGATWETVSIRSGKSELRTSVIDLTKFAGEKVIVGFELKSDESNNYSGWTVESATIKKEIVAGISPKAVSLKSSTRATLTGDFSTLDATNFPDQVVLSCEVKENGVALSTLDSSDFTVYEKIDSIWVYDSTWAEDSLFVDYRNIINSPLDFIVKRPDSTATNKYADIVFLMDNSGSMSDEQAQVEKNVLSFVDSLESKGIKAMLGLVRYGQGANSGMATIVKNGAGSWWSNYDGSNYNAADFKAMWANTNTVDGGYERSYDALMHGLEAGSYSFSKGAQRIFILITDEAMTNNNAQYSTYTDSIEVINALNAKDVTVYALSLDQEPHLSDFGNIARGTGGGFYNILDPFDDILDSIVEKVSGSYEIMYSPTRKIFDGLKRDVEIEVTHNGNTLLLSGQDYTPGEAPKVELTQQTLDTLHSGTPYLEKTDAPVQIYVYDYDAPRPHDGNSKQYVKLYYNSVVDKADVYKELSMTCDSVFGIGDTAIWSVNIPANDVLTPGIRYYIVASDSVTATPSPTQNIQYMWTFAVWPNYAPVLTDSTHYLSVSATDTMIKEGYVIGDSIHFRLHAFDTTLMVRNPYIYISEANNAQFNPIQMNSVGNGIYSFDTVVAGGNTEYFFMATDNYGVSSWLGTEFNPFVIKTKMIDPNYRHTINLAGGSPFTGFWNATVQWVGMALEAGDSIKVYVDDLLGQKCIATKAYNATSFIVKGDDPNVSGKDGFYLNDDIIFKIYKASTGKIYDADFVVKNTLTDDVTFKDKGVTNLDSLIVYGQVSTLTEEDNLWSTYVNLSKTSFNSIFEDMGIKVEMVQDHSGNVWRPNSNSTNTLTNYVAGYGYKVFLENNSWPLDMITFGKQRRYSNDTPEINIAPKFTYVGCPYKEAESLENIANANSEFVSFTKLELGTLSVYYPGYPAYSSWNTDLNMYPGKAYRLSSYGTSTFNLIFPSPVGARTSSASIKSSEAKTYPQKVRDEMEYMHLLLPEKSWETPPTNGDMVKVYSQSGDLIGQNYVFNNGTSLLIDGLDLANGEAFEIRYEEAGTGRQTNIAIEEWEHGDATYSPNKMAVAASLKSIDDNPDGISVSDVMVYPNPIKESINLTIEVSESSVLKVVVTDVTGAVVYTGADCEYAKGKHSISIPSDYTEGVYTLIVIGNGVNISKQIVIE